MKQSKMKNNKMIINHQVKSEMKNKIKETD